MNGWNILHTEASDGWGGQEIRIISEMEGLRKRGYSLFLAATPKSQIVKEAKKRGMAVEVVPMNRSRWPEACFTLWRLIHLKGIDLINTHSSADSWIASVAVHLSKRRPLLVRTRHISTPISNKMTSRLLYNSLPDGIITTSEGIKKEMVRKNRYRADKIISIPTGVDLSRFDPDRLGEGLRKEWGVSISAPIVGTIGVLRSWKGHSYFIQAARIVLQKRPEAVFFIVGDGPMRPQLEKEINLHHLEDKVRLIGYHPDVEQAFAAFDLFVLASTANEGIPQAILQAFAMKKPVIATTIGGITEVVKEGVTGRLVPAKDPRVLAEQILIHLDHPSIEKGMVEAGRCLVEEEFNLERMLDRIEQFYDRLLKERKDA